MKRNVRWYRQVLCVLPLVLLAVVPAHATKRAVEWLDLATLQAYEGRHDAALASVDSALVLEPSSFEARLLRARLLSWKKRYDAADSALRALNTEYPANADVGLVLAYLRYYQGRLDDAATGFQGLLIADPDNGDAREGLAAVNRARTQPPRPPALKRWRIDAGGEYSALTRGSLSDWNQQFVQVARRVDPGTAGPTFLFGRVERFERFALTDWSLEAGLYREFSSRLRGSFTGGWTPDADFRPQARFAIEGEWLALAREENASTLPDLWLLATGRYDMYAGAEFIGLLPGVRVDWRRGWSVTGRLANVSEVGGGDVIGWSVRADGMTNSPSFGPLRDDVRFWFGLADSPETERIAGRTETISTFSVFGGMGVDIVGDWSVILGYAHDDREGSWARHVFNAGIARVF